MPEKFEDIILASRNLKEAYAARDSDFDTYNNMYLLDDSTLPDQDDIKVTISPDPRNKVDGSTRLMTATEPTFTVSRDTNETDVEEKSSKLETWAKALWTSSGRVSRKPIEMPAIKSALLYDEIHIQVISTKALAERLIGAEKKRAEAVSKRAPLLFEVLNPKNGYPEMDALGLRSYYTQSERTVSYVKGLWDKAEKQLQGQKDTAPVTYNEYWSIDTHCVWIEGQTEPLLLEDHKLPAIPIVCQTIEGVDFFEDLEDTRQPFLYALSKSKLWERQNLTLTALYTSIFEVATGPQYVAKLKDKSEDLNIDFSVTGGAIKIEVGESLDPMNKNAIDPALLQGYEIADSKTEESTIYGSALGQPLGANAPFSMVALLSQAGRLPLVPVQKMAGWALADAMYVGFQILRSEGGKRTTRGNGGIEIIAKDIPEVFDLECSLEIDLPQDERQNAQIALELSGGEDPMVSKRWSVERYLGIGQYDDMLEEIWGEKYANLMFQQEFVRRVAELQAQMQPQQGQPQGLPQGQPPGPQQEIPPQMQGQMQGQQPPPELMQQQGAQPGLPMTEPIPPAGAPPEELPPM